MKKYPRALPVFQVHAILIIVIVVIILSLGNIYTFSRLSQVNAEIFTLGYLTGSQRSPGDLDYQRPG